MTDRFYPVGLHSDMDVWKSSYEVQNEMRSFARSAYPPGCAVHLPGARDTFGFSNAGPIRARLSQPDLFPSEDVDIMNPRESHAMTRIQVPDDRLTFESHDADEMGRSYRSPVAAVHFSPNGTGMRKTRSLPSLTRPPVPSRTSYPPEAIHSIEDDHFNYFVPKGMQRAGKEKMNPHLMSKLHKKDKISFPFSGEGTGFRTQSGPTQLFPEGSYKDISTSSRTTYAKPSFYRLSPLL